MLRAVCLTVLALLLPAASAAAIDLPRQYDATVSIAGGYTITERQDTTAPCRPGQRYTLVHDVDVDLRTTMQITAHPRGVGGIPRRRVAGGRQTSKVKGYEETNWCAPTAKQKLVAPECRSYAFGPTEALLSTIGRRGWLGVLRYGAGSQTTACETAAVDAVPGRAKINGIDGSPAGFTLPLDLNTRSFYTLGKGKKLIRRVQIGGSCDKAFVYHGNEDPLAEPDADATCTVKGVVNVEIKRLR